MQKYHLFRLHFTSPLHLALGKNEVYESSHEILHSDTLKSAIFACGLQLYDTTTMNPAFLASFTISSAFPFKIAGGKVEYFFPKPMSPLPLNFEELKEGEEAKAAKKMKKLSFLGKSFFEAIICGKTKTVASQHLIHDGKFISEILSPSDKIMKAEIQERVNLRHLYDIDVTQKEARPFQLERIYWEENAGLFFLVQTEDQEMIEKLRSILKLLGDSGIGTDRNVGNGMFRLEEEADWQLAVSPLAQKQISLSLYLPKLEELKTNVLDNSAYLLKKRGGYVASPANPDHASFRKHSVYMMTEGSVFPKANLSGKMVDIAPQIMSQAHPVWRDGRALFIPMFES